MRTGRILVLVSLLTLGNGALAQAWSSESTEADTTREYTPPLAWPKADDDSMQTFVGIRHNGTDGTVVGLSLRPPGYPALQVELDIVPPGYGPIEQEEARQPSLVPDNQRLRTVHKLSLRYRF